MVNIVIAWQDSLQDPHPMPLLQETPFLNDPFISIMEVVYLFFEPSYIWALILCEAVFQKLVIQWWTKLSSSPSHGTYILLKGDSKNLINKEVNKIVVLCSNGSGGDMMMCQRVPQSGGDVGRKWGDLEASWRRWYMTWNLKNETEPSMPIEGKSTCCW